jgi:circadian clock protein KaiC
MALLSTRVSRRCCNGHRAPTPFQSKRFQSGVDRLDTMLGGGLPLASTTKVMGASGVGKTTLGLQFLSRSSETEPGLLFGLYETPVRINAKVDEICQPLRGLIDSGVVDVIWQPPTDGLLDLHGERLLDGVRRRGVKRLFVDGLNAFQSASVERLRLNQYLTALVNELRVLGVTTVFALVVPDVIGQYTRSPIDGDFLNLADNLILMRCVEVRSRLHRLVSIIKVRDSDFDSSAHEYVITDQGLRIADTGDSAEAILGQSQHQDHATPRRDKDSRRRRGA